MPPNKPTLAQLPPAAQSLVGRWRLVLGKEAEAAGVCMSPGGSSGGEDQQGAEQALSFLTKPTDLPGYESMVQRFTTVDLPRLQQRRPV